MFKGLEEVGVGVQRVNGSKSDVKRVKGEDKQRSQSQRKEEQSSKG